MTKAFAALGAVFLCLIAGPAFAQASAPIPVGDLATGVIDFVWPVVTAGVLFLVRKLPSQIAWVMTAARVEQLLNAARTYAVNATRDAAHDRPFTLPVGNEVARMMVEYSLAHGPMLVNLFGLARWREKAIARLQFEADVVVAPPAVAAK